MKRLLTYTLLFAILSQPFSRLGIVLSFKIRQAEIAAKLCENLNKPELDCQGTCYLKKQLKELEEQEKQLPQNLKDKEVVLYCNNFFPTFQFSTFIETIFVEKNYNSFYLTMKPASFHSDIFHPPSA
jgi:hypothetical protein